MEIIKENNTHPMDTAIYKMEINRAEMIYNVFTKHGYSFKSNEERNLFFENEVRAIDNGETTSYYTGENLICIAGDVSVSGWEDKNGVYFITGNYIFQEGDNESKEITEHFECKS